MQLALPFVAEKLSDVGHRQTYRSGPLAEPELCRLLIDYPDDERVAELVRLYRAAAEKRTEPDKPGATHLQPPPVRNKGGRPRTADPETVALIRRLRGGGASLARIVLILNCRAVPTPTGRGKWGRGSVAHLLKGV